MNSIRTFSRPYNGAYYGRKQIIDLSFNRVVYANGSKEIAYSITHGGRTQGSIVALEMKDAGATYTRRNLIIDALKHIGVIV